MIALQYNQFSQSSSDAREDALDSLSGSGFEEAYRLSLQKTVRTVQALGATLDNAEEIAQAAWAKGWEYRLQLKNPDALTAWIATIARNLYRSWIVNEKKFDELQECVVPSDLVPNSEAKAILSVCSTLEAKMLQMYYLEGYTAQEISETENLCPATIRVRLLRIRRTLKTRLAPANGLAA